MLELTGPARIAAFAPPKARPAPPRPASAPDPLVRLADVTLAAMLLIAILPLILLAALCIFASDGASPLFVQRRLGRGGTPFACLKLRTMAPDAERRLAALLAADPAARTLWQSQQKLVADPRVTPLGRLLRLTSIDELPQLVNILLGDMSLVGPRPIVAAEVGRYGRRFAAYCDRRPGLTGLWQVSGRSRSGYARRLACDRLFARRRSLTLYLRILAATVPTVLLARGAC
jgi:exopolysaccharide production protein ExoY